MKFAVGHLIWLTTVQLAQADVDNWVDTPSPNASGDWKQQDDPRFSSWSMNNAAIGDTDTWDFTTEWSEKGYITIPNERGLFYWVWDGYDVGATQPQGRSPFVFYVAGHDTLAASGIKDLFFLNGPYKIVNFPGPWGEDTLKMAQNPFKWSVKANFVWVDQPAGVGFSYTNSSVRIDTVGQAADDLCEFLTQFFDIYEQYTDNELILAGDGLAARVLLKLSDKLLDAKNGGDNACPATYYAGLALAGPNIVQEDLWRGMLYVATENELFDKDVMDMLPVKTEVCISQMEICRNLSPLSGSYDAAAWATCYADWQECRKALEAPALTGSNHRPFDKFDWRSISCKFFNREGPENVRCYTDHLTGLDRWLNEDYTLEDYGIPSNVSFNYANFTVTDYLDRSGTLLEDMTPYVERALDSKIRVLLWTGGFDYYCPPKGLEMTLDSITWGDGQYTGKEQATEQRWGTKSDPPQTTRGADGKSIFAKNEVSYWRNDYLTYAVLHMSGHHLAFQAPRASQLFFTDWMYGFGDSLSTQAETSRATYTKIAIIAGVIAGLCVLGGITFFCGCCPNAKYTRESATALDNSGGIEYRTTARSDWSAQQTNDKPVVSV